MAARKSSEAGALLTQASPRADDALRTTIEHDLAWLLAVAPDDDVRNGQRAVELTQKVLLARGQPNAGLCDTLAAAFADQGDFTAAVRWQNKVTELRKNEDGNEIYRQRLPLYEAGKTLTGLSLGA